MLINFNHLKTFGNAIVQKMKDFRSDWNQNDPTADDYIKNRTHYVEIGEAVVLPLTTLTSAEVQLQQPLAEGQTYLIIWDGVTYESVAREYDGYLLLGNNAIYDYDNGIETDTGEPFALETEQGNTWAFIYLPVAPKGADGDEIAQHTISIITYGEIVHKLDKKFIDMPDGIVTEESLYPILENNLAPVAFTNNYDSLSGKPTIYTDVVRYANSQSLTATQKNVAKSNINAVGYDVQSLTETQKVQARENIGAGTSNFSGNYNDLSDKPSCLELESVVTGNLPVVENWTSVCYGNGIYVAISGISGELSNVVAYSTNGITWEQSNLSRSLDWSSVCYGDGKFVAVLSYGNIAAYSLDGVNWVESSLPFTSRWSSVCYGDGKFVVLTKNNTKMAYSTDGINWIESASNFTFNCNSVCYGNNKFVGVGYFSGSNIKAYYSTDGLTWTSVNMLKSNYWSSVCYGNGKFVAVCHTNKNTVAYSDDGITWKESTLPIYDAWSSVCYGNGKFVAMCTTNIVAYSDDGITWTQGSLPLSSSWSSICYGDGKFVAVAKNSDVSIYSKDGINWCGTPNKITTSNIDVTEETVMIIKSHLQEDIKKHVNAPKFNLVLTDEITGLEYVIAIVNGNLISYRTTENITVTTMPNKTSYINKEAFDPTGMIVTAIDADGFTREITNYTYDTIIDYDSMVTDDGTCNLTIYYTEGNKTFTTTVNLNVHSFSLIDFNYTANEDGTFTLNSWKGTYNGEPSTKIIVPDSELIIV